VGLFRIPIGVESARQRSQLVEVADTLVDTGSDATCTATIDEVVFGEETDFPILGARTLEGMNLRVDPVKKILLDAGPMLAVVAA